MVEPLQVKAPQTVVLANPFAIGDVVMMLPLAGAIRRHWPDVKLHFAGRQPALTQACEFFDSIIDSDEIVADPALLKRIGTDVFLNPFSCDAMARAAFAARVPVRVGNLLRRRSAAFSNRFVAYPQVRYKHMLEYSMRHVQAIGVPAELPSEPRALFGLTRVGAAPERLRRQLDTQRFNLILHPKSGGSSREWPLQHYLQLARLLGETDAFKLFVTGTPQERQRLEQECPDLLRNGLATDLMGTLSSEELLTFISAADGVLAASTGPLHLAAALGRHALGIFPTRPGMDITCWRPLGLRAGALCSTVQCHPRSRQCPKKTGPPCICTQALQAQEVASQLVMPALRQWRGEARRAEPPLQGSAQSSPGSAWRYPGESRAEPPG